MIAVEQVRRLYPEIPYDLTELRRLSLEYLLKKYDYDPGESYRLIELYLELGHEVEFFPDVIPALKLLSSQFKLVTLTNGNADVDRLQIGEKFSAQIRAGDNGAKKPDKKIFLHACESIGVMAGNVLHVGDNPEEDVIAAEQVGMKSVWINRFRDEWIHEKLPEAEFKDLNKFVDYLKKKGCD